jgi:DNA-directed RNA polymerase delta subunit
MSDTSNIMNFKTMAEMANNVNDARKMIVYCDYIANLIQKNLKFDDSRYMSMLTSVGSMQYDLNPDGSFRSPTKTIMVEDINGNKYKITVEEV